MNPICTNVSSNLGVVRNNPVVVSCGYSSPCLVYTAAQARLHAAQLAEVRVAGLGL